MNTPCCEHFDQTLQNGIGVCLCAELCHSAEKQLDTYIDEMVAEKKCECPLKDADILTGHAKDCPSYWQPYTTNTSDPQDIIDRCVEIYAAGQAAERDRIIALAEEMKKEIPQDWKDKDLKWGTIPAPVMARVEHNDALGILISKIKGDK
jgi:hypothetical protein